MTTSFTRMEAMSALKVLEDALDAPGVWEVLHAVGQGTGAYASLSVIEDYLRNSKAVPLTTERSREELYAQQVGASAA